MQQEKKSLLIKYGICFGVAAVIAVLVFGARGFFTDNAGVNIQILSDGFFVSGIVLLAYAGMMFISGEGPSSLIGTTSKMPPKISLISLILPLLPEAITSFSILVFITVNRRWDNAPA